MTDVLTTVSTAFATSDEAIAALRDEFSGLSADTPAGYEDVRKAIAVTRSLRVQVEKKRVELKADALEWGRKVDAEAKRLTALLSEIEDPLKAKKQAIDDEKERLRLQKEREARERMEEQLRLQREAEEARLRAEREKEELRLAQERIRLEEERRRIEAERRAADEAARIERERQAVEMQKIREQQEAERRAIEAERRRLADEKEAIAKAEAARIAAEKAKRDAEERAEQLKIEAERRARRLAEERAAHEARMRELEPDKEKLRRLAGSIRDIGIPRLSSDEAVRFVGGIATDLEAIAAKCDTFGN